MRTIGILFAAIFVAVLPTLGQPGSDDNFKLALAQHNGQLSWTANGFKIVQSSVKQNGDEIGIRGRDSSGLEFLSFLFLFSEQAPMTSTKCLEGVIGPEKSANKSFRALGTSEIAQPNNPPVALIDYSEQSGNGKTSYMVRGFVAAGDTCGDLELYGDKPIHAADPDIHRIFTSFKLDPDYVPQFHDVFLYAQMLYNTHRYAAAGPLYEQALSELKTAPGEDLKTITRVLVDQAGMSYGISGNTDKARSIFEHAIASDPDYPMYYYNLACADAQEHKLADARKHLQEAFDRRANVIHGEAMPDPAQDDSFTPYQNDKQFWLFVKSLSSQ